MKSIISTIILIFSFIFSVAAQQSSLSGYVRDNNSNPVPGASVILNGSTGAATDASGYFSVNKLKAGTYEVIVSFTGFGSFTDKITIAEGDNDLDFQITPSVIDINQVVVTATRSGVPLRKVPIHTQVVFGEELRKTDSKSLADVLTNYFPGIDFKNGMSYAGGPQIVMNGLSAKYILILVDGERLSSGDVKESVDFNRINTENIERVEIVRGAASSLYGTDAIGGVINIITKTSVEDAEGSFGIRSSDYQETRMSGDLGLNFGKVSSRSSFIYNSMGGYDLQPDVAGLTIEPTKSFNFNQKLRYSASENLNISGDLSIFNREDDTEIPGSLDRKYDDFTWKLGADYRLGTKSRLSLAWNSDRYRSYRIEETTREQLNHYDKTFNSLRLQGNVRLWDANNLVAGVEYNGEELFSANTLDTAKSASAVIGFVQDVWDILPNLTFVAGGRVTSHSEYGMNTTYQAALNYRPGNFSIRTSYGTGFRAPTLKELYMNFKIPGAPIRIIGNPDLEPEKSTYYSASVEYTNSKFNSSVLVQYNELESTITELFMGGFPMIYQYQNVEGVKILNTDLLINYRIIPQLLVSGGYTLTLPADSASEASQNRVDARKHSAVFNIEYSRITGKYRPVISLQTKYYGSNTITWTDELSGQDSEVDLTDYFNLKLTTLHRINNMFTITLGIDNVLDFTDPTYFNSLSPGRRFFAGVRFDF